METTRFTVRQEKEIARRLRAIHEEDAELAAVLWRSGSLGELAKGSTGDNGHARRRLSWQRRRLAESDRFPA